MDIYSTRERIRKENINFMNLPLRVTFYARVSTDFNVQLNSLDNQITYYTDFIRKNPNWEYVDGYVDEGISGVSTAKRERFNEMIEDAKAGMFDLIVTKEVSRFARNTLDSIRFTRELLSSGVAVYFQNDNINTLDEDSELRLTIMSSMAQDESRKISTRVRFGHQQAIKKGTVLGTNNMYGYIKKDGKLMIDETQADFVRELFEMYATGKFSMKQMEKQGLSLPTADEWAYLCGGGCRTLFPWGDGLDYSMRLHWFENMDEDENRPYDMEEPNFFGLSIAYDPYMREVVQADRLTTCGGDGGCNICGGLGPFLGFLPCSPHCKPEVQEDNELNGDYDFYRPIIRLENYD